MDKLIEEAFEKFDNETNYGTSTWDGDVYSDWEIEEIYTAGAEWGIKQSRIDTLQEINKKWLNQDFAQNGAEDIIKYINTELKKVRE